MTDSRVVDFEGVNGQRDTGLESVASHQQRLNGDRPFCAASNGSPFPGSEADVSNFCALARAGDLDGAIRGIKRKALC